MQSNNEQPLVSVVMPVYNAERFLRQAIESVLMQTYENIELIMVDDCSQDGSLQIMSEYEARDNRVHVVKCEKNQGVAHARNCGIRRADGEYIALLDSDDVWYTEKLENQIRLLLKEKASIVYCSLVFIDEQGNRMKSFLVPEKTDYKEMLYKCYFSCSTVVVESKLLKEHLFRADYYHEDYLLWVELLKLNVKAVGEPTVLAGYRQIAGSRSNNKLNAAKHRWRIYRKALGMNLLQSSIVFAKYAFWGVVKYSR